FNAIEEFRGEYRCITADLRNAPSGQSTGPIEVDRPWESYADDQLGLMDHLGIDKFMVMGFCIGGPFIAGLLKRAPNRIAAAVMAQPVGWRPEMRDRKYPGAFWTSWGAALIAKRPEIAMQTTDQFVTRMFETNPDFLFTVTRDFIRSCQNPILVLPDDVPAHPLAVAMECAMLAPKSEALWRCARFIPSSRRIGPRNTMMKRFLFGAAMLLAGSAFAQQRAPEILFTSVPNYPNLPEGMNFGEVPGVAVNSNGHVFVFSRSNSANGPAFGAAAAQLFEFDQKGNFVREIGKGLYAWSEAHSVRIDRNDNIWAIDKGSNMIVRFNPQGRVVWVFGRKQEAADGAEPLGHPNPPLPPVDGNFRQPTDIAWDSQDNTYITDGYVNSRVAKFDKNGDWVKSWGSKGTGPGQFDIPHSIAIDLRDNIYVG